MSSIIAPSPRRVAHAHFQDELKSSSAARNCHASHPSSPIVNPELVPSPIFLSPPRLLSPIAFSESHFLTLKSKSPTPCGAALRRGTTRVTRSVNKRRRFTHRIESPHDACGYASVFDHLPWTSAMELPPRLHPCDTADLSQLPIGIEESNFSDAIPASGPVRRRKTSLRSNPLGENPESETPEFRQPFSFPFRQSPSGGRDFLKTPPPKVHFDPTRVTFHGLMPVFPHSLPVAQHSPL